MPAGSGRVQILSACAELFGHSPAALALLGSWAKTGHGGE